MPKDGPLTKEKTTFWTRRGFRKPTGDIELTDRAKDKLRGQISRAERIMRVEEPQSKGWHKGLELKNRAQKLLDGKKSSPSKKPSDPEEKYRKRREPVERATRTSKLRSALEEVAKAAQQRNGG